ncbi:DegT/DnrJ/EryC1/StrS family aminotransferase [Paracoccus sp. Z118]|uniref:DegT/DnrJ/EryC1/StrS family aminotransferase n=1 Tax=Paracoccus sp. Z118 TaxID=2851017 RepID=UPI001C2C8DB0|nr:DegT/DnrJ/EryC1/StrS family aminotransferase [Paracoccus sp. Z118]MBV0891656.1 DegT/DnrJ/EryC1/StrS family aminotransferase [Paracoccus sp. Z118]
MFYPLASTTWNDQEHAALQRVIASGRYTMGPEVRAFEEAFARHFGKRYAVMTSSGSTANLLAIASAFWHPDLGWRQGDEVIVPAVSWSTTYFPVTQTGLTLRFVDIDPATLNIDLDKLEQAITPRTRAVFAVNLLGNPVQADRLRAICDRHGIVLAEDNCESMGARFGDEQAGTFGLFGTFSSFFSHHICTMEGGMVVTDDRKLYDTMLSMRAHGWTRDLPDDTHLPRDPDPFVRQFRFVLPGYNLRPLEMEGALGIPQLEKLPGFVAERRANGQLFQQAFGGLDFLDIQQETGESSWFGFAMILRGRLEGRRADLVAALQAAGIECRPIVTGNFLANPVIEKLDHSVFGTVEAAENVDRNGLFTGNHHYPIAPQIARLREVVQDVADRF